MQLRDLQQYLAIDIAESLEERFMDDEALYLRFLRKLLTTQDFSLLEQYVQEGNWAEALRKAHNLKGVCASLGLVSLAADFAELVTLLRSDSFTAQQVRTQLEDLRSSWQQTLHYIEQVEVC